MKPTHIAIIMDGNGRWAKAHGKPRLSGHEAGVETVRRIIKATRKHGIQYLTLYAFSVENWSRPSLEIRGLMSLLQNFLSKNEKEFHENQIRLRVLGRRSDLPKKVNDALNKVEAATAHYTKATLVLALSYGGRTEIAHAAQALAKAACEGKLDPAKIDEAAVAAAMYLPDIPDPDLIIRTSGEMRISNFLLWQCAYSEFYFTQTLWPDFSEADVDAAIEDFSNRSRRFGGLEKAHKPHESGTTC